MKQLKLNENNKLDQILHSFIDILSNFISGNLTVEEVFSPETLFTLDTIILNEHRKLKDKSYQEPIIDFYLYFYSDKKIISLRDFSEKNKDEIKIFISNFEYMKDFQNYINGELDKLDDINFFQIKEIRNHFLLERMKKSLSTTKEILLKQTYNYDCDIDLNNFKEKWIWEGESKVEDWKYLVLDLQSEEKFLNFLEHFFKMEAQNFIQLEILDEDSSLFYAGGLLIYLLIEDDLSHEYKVQFSKIITDRNFKNLLRNENKLKESYAKEETDEYQKELYSFYDEYFEFYGVEEAIADILPDDFKNKIDVIFEDLHQRFD